MEPPDYEAAQFLGHFHSEMCGAYQGIKTGGLSPSPSSKAEMSMEKRGAITGTTWTKTTVIFKFFSKEKRNQKHSHHFKSE